jgi:hypothetical protein
VATEVSNTQRIIRTFKSARGHHIAVNGDKVVLSTFRIELRGTQIPSDNADDGWIEFDSQWASSPAQACSLQCPVFPAGINAGDSPPDSVRSSGGARLASLRPRFPGTAMAASAILQQVWHFSFP